MKKVLIISFHYLPEVMAASYRMYAWAKYLPEFGWQPIILTKMRDGLKTKYLTEKSKNFIKEFDKQANCITYRALYNQKFKKVWDLRGRLSSKKNPSIIHIIGRKLLSFVIRNFLLIPDEKVGWYKTASKSALSIIKKHQFDIILATGPPWTDFKIASDVSRATGIPWIADYRDPWTQPTTKGVKKEYVIWHLISRFLEKRLSKTASGFIHISEPLQKGFLNIIDRDVHLIGNGFDPENFREKRKFAPDEKKLIISFIGTLHSNTVTKIFLEGFHRFVKANNITPQICNIEFIGDTNGYRRIEETYPGYNEIEDFIHLKPPIPQKEANRKMCQSHILLLFPLDMKGCIPAKTYEYLASGRPILVSPSGKYQESIKKLIARTRGGVIFDSPEKIANWLNAKFDEFLKTGFVESFTKLLAVEEYSREIQVQILAEILDKTVENSSSIS